MERAETPGDPTSSVESTRSTADPARSAIVWTIVVGGGSGQRFGRPKQYETLDHRRVIDLSREVAAASTDGVVLVVPAADVEREGGVAGGETRSASVRAGLAAVPESADVICVHDAARPLASADIYRRVIDAVLGGADAAIPAVAVTDTIKAIDRPVDAASDGWGHVVETPDRARLVAVQTPQAFRADRLRAAHASESDASDDATLVEASGGTVVVVRGETNNRKITEPGDLEWARRQVAPEADR